MHPRVTLAARLAAVLCLMLTAPPVGALMPAAALSGGQIAAVRDLLAESPDDPAAAGQEPAPGAPADAPGGAGSTEGGQGAPPAPGSTVTIRIGLAHVRRAEVDLSGPFAVQLEGSTGAAPASVQGRVTVEPDPGDSSRLRVHLPGQPAVAAAQVDLVRQGLGEFYYQGVPYRGSVRMLRRGGDVVVINVVSLEEYLWGVLPREMPSNWHREALKAQAVAARTYAVANRGRFEADGYDLTADTRSQVYGGILAEKSATTAAVNETAGLVLRFQGKIISAFYSASNGGYTADPAEVWGGSLGYLRAQPDPYDAGVSPHMNWEVTLSGADLQRIVPDGATILDVAVAERGPSGRVVRLDIITDRGVISHRRDTVRSVLGSKSSLLDVAVLRIGAVQVWVLGAGGKTRGGNLAAVGSSGKAGILTGSVAAQGAGGTAVLGGGDLAVTVRGSGWGHGVGLSQWGAKGRADAGQDFRQILAFYYPGAELTPVQ